MRVLFLIAVLCFTALAGDTPPLPWVDRVHPLGAMRGATVEVELRGSHLANATAVWFDSARVEWLETLEAASGRVRGRVRVADDAPLGPHVLEVLTLDGRSNGRLFNVTQYPATMEREPNDAPGQAQRIELRPQVIHGGLDELRDIDVFSFEAKEGERWTFDVRSMEYGSHLECEMALLDEDGREAAFNDDRDDYLETPFIEHVFETSGVHYLKVDQYRGPQRVDCSNNCGYMLRISQLPVIEAAFPLGARAGETARVSIRGRALDGTDEVWLAPARRGEYYRLTFPFSMPLRAGDESSERISGRIVSRSPDEIVAEFSVPAEAPLGLWRLWARGPDGEADGVSFEIGDLPELSEKEASRLDWRGGPLVINGSFDGPGEEDEFWIEAEAGKPLRFWTLAAQLGLPYIDTVLELFDEGGQLVAEHDDLMSGQGTVIGNPDSDLFWIPEKSGKYRLVLRERIGRGGTTYIYRLKAASQHAGFRLLTDPSNFTVAPGSETELSVLLIREPGFEGGVDVWVEGLPEGAEAGKARFRAEQFFGPSADGDNIVIPQADVKIRVPAGLPTGEYPIRVFGKGGLDDRVVEAFTTLWIGAPRMRNDIRRPMPGITMTAIEPFEPRLWTESRSLQLTQGEPAMLEATAKALPDDAEISLAGVPDGVAWRIVSRGPERIILAIDASPQAQAGRAMVSVEAAVDGRRAATAPIALILPEWPDPSTASR